MIYLRQTFRLHPNQYERCTQFFNDYTLPLHRENGARLTGRYVTKARDEITTLWEYNSYEHYKTVNEKIKQSELFKESEKRRKEVKPLYLDEQEEFMEATGDYQFPKHIVSVSAYITNDAGEVLLVKNEHRNDTYEMPGGRMEMGETLEEAVRREVFEETGITADIKGITGVYQNVTRGIVCVVFKGVYRSGDLRTQPGETQEVFFKDLNKGELDNLVTKEHFKVRITDARDREGVTVESYYVRPYEVVHRLES
ncbi:NUDIX hydrolase [Halobacillus mangrovi]|uniref:Nudix hydrolase domain-containing protein n=1 Tax=Halobacillus mangrovi TaxID=402384 RepID=A0A1W5ZYD6_9BACI|nr:NUDIX hydrolase [Halobacillus mangrovi]ARI78273.1 hypothetical protein HM131_16150 [Halobacillus mangrovi]